MNNRDLTPKGQPNVFEQSQEIPVPQEVRMNCLSNVEMKPVQWLWKNRLALGKLSVLAGEPGLGKSQTTASLAAAVSTGGHWPELAPAAPLGDVLFISAEDDPADTIKPRLVAVGADVKRCHVVEAVHLFEKKNPTGEAKEKIRAIDLKEDVERLEKAIRQLNNPMRCAPFLGQGRAFN